MYQRSKSEKFPRPATVRKLKFLAHTEELTNEPLETNRLTVSISSDRDGHEKRENQATQIILATRDAKFSFTLTKEKSSINEFLIFRSDDNVTQKDTAHLAFSLYTLDMKSVDLKKKYSALTATGTMIVLRPKEINGEHELIKHVWDFLSACNISRLITSQPATLHLSLQPKIPIRLDQLITILDAAVNLEISSNPEIAKLHHSQTNNADDNKCLIM